MQLPDGETKNIEAQVDSPRWLSVEEQCSWRHLLSGLTVLQTRMDTDLTPHGATLSEYEILVLLSEQDGRELRMSALAERVSQSRSRLTHTATRLAGRGWVERRRVPGDGRGVALWLTDEGLAAVERLAPVHVESVRRRVVDLLSAEEFSALGEMMRAVTTGEPTAAVRGPYRDGSG